MMIGEADRSNEMLWKFLDAVNQEVQVYTVPPSGFRNLSAPVVMNALAVGAFLRAKNSPLIDAFRGFYLDFEKEGFLGSVPNVQKT
jgi:hypothetical protein